jgi:hypothetical protein
MARALGEAVFGRNGGKGGQCSTKPPGEQSGGETACKNGISRLLTGEIHGFFIRLNGVLRLTPLLPRRAAANLNVPFRYFL